MDGQVGYEAEDDTDLSDVASDEQWAGWRRGRDRPHTLRGWNHPQNIDDTLGDAFAQRQISVIFTTEPVPRGAGGCSRFSGIRRR